MSRTGANLELCIKGNFFFCSFRLNNNQINWIALKHAKGNMGDAQAWLNDQSNIS